MYQRSHPSTSSARFPVVSTTPVTSVALNRCSVKFRHTLTLNSSWVSTLLTLLSVELQSELHTALIDIVYGHAECKTLPI
jgi:hypothetical protein